MRNQIIRTILGIAGVALTGAACGFIFSIACAALSLALYWHFVLALIALVMACIANFCVVIPRVAAWIGQASPARPAGEQATALVKSLNERYAHIFKKAA